MTELLPQIGSPADLQRLTDAQLTQLAQEMRDELVRVLSIRPAHFASNLGVVELCLALHLTFDFSKDRVIWDTGHQIYPHKLVTGRYPQFGGIRTRGGLMGYPNPHESEYDLFMTGHAGCSVSCALGLKAGDDLLGQEDRHSVAVIGDGALPSGIVFEALNNAGGLRKDMLVILNDNEMSICPRVGALASCLDQVRMTHFYQDSKKHVRDLLARIPLVGGMATHAIEQMKDGLKAFLTGGMLFEELGFRYFGPVDGHDLPSLRPLAARREKPQGARAAARADPEGPRCGPGQRRSGDVPHASGVREGGSRAHHPVVEARWRPRLHRRRQHGHPRGDGGRPEGHGADGGHVPGQQAGKGAGRVSGSLFRRRHLRIARRGVRGRHGQGGHAAHCGYLFDVLAAFLRPDLPGSRAAEPPGGVLPGSRRPDRTGRPDAPRRLRHSVHAAVPEPSSHGAGRRARRGPDAEAGAVTQRPRGAALSQDEPGARRSGGGAAGTGTGGGVRVGRGRR